ncbi:hypothetical protein ACJX0J_036897 [Zea mays]
MPTSSLREIIILVYSGIACYDLSQICVALSKIFVEVQNARDSFWILVIQDSSKEDMWIEKMTRIMAKRKRAPQLFNILEKGFIKGDEIIQSTYYKKVGKRSIFDLQSSVKIQKNIEDYSFLDEQRTNSTSSGELLGVRVSPNLALGVLDFSLDSLDISLLYHQLSREVIITLLYHYFLVIVIVSRLTYQGALFGSLFLHTTSMHARKRCILPTMYRSDYRLNLRLDKKYAKNLFDDRSASFTIEDNLENKPQIVLLFSKMAYALLITSCKLCISHQYWKKVAKWAIELSVMSFIAVGEKLLIQPHIASRYVLKGHLRLRMEYVMWTVTILVMLLILN